MLIRIPLVISYICEYEAKHWKVCKVARFGHYMNPSPAGQTTKGKRVREKRCIYAYLQSYPGSRAVIGGLVLGLGLAHYNKCT